MRRNNVPGGRRRQPFEGPGGPLMTNHLENIDLELELLKRKREMIEQQQMLMMDHNMPPSRQYNFDYDSMVYEDREPRGSNNDIPLYHNNQYGRKREANPRWNNDNSYKKRDAKRARGNQSNYNNRMESRYDSPSFSARSYSPKPGPSSNNRGPKRPPPSTKVPPKNQTSQFKPQPSLPSKSSQKRASSYQTERKSSAPVATKTSYKGVQNILLPEQTPTPQVTGRLELALGCILKEVHKKYGATPVHLHRLMKQTIRERIRAVMLGKLVGNAPEILEHYREEFPPETDIDIINIAKEAEKKGPVKENVTLAGAKPVPGTCSPEMQLKNKLIKLLDVTLKEMFTKIENIYTKEKENSEKDTKDDKETTEVEESSEDTPPKTHDELEKGLSAEFEALYKIISPIDLKRLIPRLIKNYVPFIIKMLCANTQFISERVDIVTEMKKKISEWKKAEAEAEADSNETAQKIAERNAGRGYVDLPYNVKVMGLPTLPKKTSMQTFLDQFNPKSIKKHKNIHNLLFVGFSDKTDFTNIIHANGTKIGRLVISVKESDKLPRNNPNASNTCVEDDQNKDANPDNSDLDTQISDLLTSIRKAEENCETTNKVKDVDAIDEEGTNEEETKNVADSQYSKEESGNKIDTEESQENPDLNEETETNDNLLGDVTNDDEENNMETETLQPGDVDTTELMESIETENDSMEVSETDKTEQINVSEGQTSKEVEKNNGEVEKNNGEVEKNSGEVEKNNVEVEKNNVEVEKNNVEVEKNNVEVEKNNVEVEKNNVEVEKNNEEVEKNNEEVEKNNEEVEKNNEEVEKHNEEDEKNNEVEQNDQVDELKNAKGRATPSRTSARLANVTPSTIRTRRASKLAQNSD